MLIFYLSLIDDESDQYTFETIYHSYKNDMLAVANHVLSNQWEAEDAVQDAMLSLAMSIKCVPTNAKEMRAYSLAAARNAALNLRKKNAKHKNNISIDTLLPFPDSDNDLFDQIIANEEYETLLHLIDQLPLSIKECFLLRYVAGMGPGEISQALSRKRDTVKKQLYRGKAMLINLYKLRTNEAK